MYLPSQLPSTRIAQSTSLLPATPAPPPAPATTPRHKTRYRPPLAGLTEEGEHLLRISSSRSHLWALLAATELSLYSNKLVLFKLTTTPLQLRTYGPNASLAWQDESRFVLSTHRHHFHYSIKSNKNPVYALPTKTAHDWPLGPGEAQSLTAIELNCQTHFEAKGNNVVTTQQYLLVPSDEPPSLLVMPFPVASDSKLPAFLPPFSADSRVLVRGKEKEVLPKWEGLGRGMMESGCPVRVGLDEWDWLVRGTPEEEAEEPTTIARILPLPGTLQEPMQRQEFVILASDGRGYLVHWGPSSLVVVPIPQKREGKEVLFDEDLETGAQEREDRERWEWKGICFHPPPAATVEGGELEEGVQAIEVVFNDAFGLLTLGCRDGTVSLYNYPSLVDPSGQVNSELGIHRPTLSHVMSLRSSLNTTVSGMQSGQVNNLSWTSDGYCLSIAWTHGYAIYSVYGRLGSWSVAPLSAIEGSASKVRSGGFGEEEGYGVQGERGVGFEDNYLNGVKSAFWSEGNLELFVLCPPPAHPKGKAYDEQIFVIPFIKSAVAGLHSPDNTKHAFLQMDDRVLVYRGADQPDMSVINPDSDVWQHIKIPSTFIALHHPIRYAVISSDARLIAVAGRKGLTHYNALSGRWKLFENEREEASLVVCGGMAWWGNSLVVGCEEAGNYYIKVFSRDLPLTLANVLESVPLVSKPHLIAIFDSSLLVYTVDNTFHHYLIREARDRAGVVRVGLRLGGSIGFEGVVGEPTRVRGMSWLVPKSQQLLGDPADDLNVATIIFLLRGQLILLRPRRVAPQEVKYDLQILCSHVEFYWTHLSGIGTLENSLWAWDGTMIRIWLERLTIEKVKVDKRRDRYESVLESVGIPLNFYPLAVLMDKGIIIGVDEETSLRRSLDFALFRIITTTHLFIPHILRYHLSQPVSELNDALAFASHYTSLVYFAHALEILLYVVLEEEVDGHAPSFALEEGEELASSVLRRTVDFLDHFDQSLKVVVGCARKTELKQWATLFGVAGKPRDLFEKCVMFGYLKEAASYLIVLHTMEPVEQSSKDTVRLLQAAQHARDWTLCRELLNFLYSLDRKGVILRAALTESSTLPSHLSPGDSASPAPSSDTATTPRISTDLEADDEETPSSAEQAHPSPSSDPPRLGSLLGRVGLPPGALVLPSRSFSAEQKK